MERHFFASDNLQDLEVLEMELEQRGVVTPQIHVLSNLDSEVANHRLHEVNSLMRTDVIRKGLFGALCGVLGGMAVLVMASASGFAAQFGWLPFVFLAVVILGFCTWEAGFLGFQLPNSRFRRFQNMLDEGRHIFFVDVRSDQNQVLTEVLSRHKGLQELGTGEGTPWWLISMQDKFQRFVRWAP
jgi:hypothetical protein